MVWSPICRNGAFWLSVSRNAPTGRASRTVSSASSATTWEALKWLTAQAAPNAKGGANTNTTQLAEPNSAVNLNMGTLVGSYASVARMLDEVAQVPDTAGVLLTFDDFEQGIEDFGTNIQPLMECRRHVMAR